MENLCTDAQPLPGDFLHAGQCYLFVGWPCPRESVRGTNLFGPQQCSASHKHSVTSTIALKSIITTDVHTLLNFRSPEWEEFQPRRQKVILKWEKYPQQHCLRDPCALTTLLHSAMEITSTQHLAEANNTVKIRTYANESAPLVERWEVNQMAMSLGAQAWSQRSCSLAEPMAGARNKAPASTENPSRHPLPSTLTPPDLLLYEHKELNWSDRYT